jgi:hypothetical protein
MSHNVEQRANGIARAASSNSRNATIAPRIVISSPTRMTYATGQQLRSRFSCSGRSGIVRCAGSLSRAGTRPRKVLSGKKLRLTKSGSYALRVTAKDRRGRFASETVRFLVERTISWSGYKWNVRAPGWGSPGPNHWSDSKANVRTSGSDLLLSVVKDASGRWTSAEVDNQRNLGYGTYRWVVASDLSALDAYQVLGMFTFGGGGSSITEIDLEPSHWGNLSWPNGSAAVWQNAITRAHESRVFNYSNHPPYVNEFTWSPGRVAYRVTDGTGATLFDWTVTTGVPRPSTEVPIINYWRFHNAPPAGGTTVRISSFSWAPLRH